MATLTVSFMADFPADLLNDMGPIKFTNFGPAVATFDAMQFDGVAISATG